MKECLTILKALSASYTLPTHIFKCNTNKVKSPVKQLGVLEDNKFAIALVIGFMSCVQYRMNSK